MRRRGTWKLYFTNDPIETITEAENATYSPITHVTNTPYYLGDPQTDGQEAVPTAVYFSFHIPITVTGIRADISGLGVNTAYSVSLGEFMIYDVPPPEPEPEPEAELPPEPEAELPPEPEPEPLIMTQRASPYEPIANSNLRIWAASSSSSNRYHNNDSSYHYDNVIDGDPDTFWISGNNTEETIGIYFEGPVQTTYQLPYEQSNIAGTNKILLETQSMDWSKEFEIKVDYTWDDLAAGSNYGRIIGWGVASSSGKGCLQISKGNAMNGYYAEIRGSDGGAIIVANSWQSTSNIAWDTLASDADGVEENTRYKMIVKNIPSSNELIVAIQKYNDFTSWENTLANKRLFIATTVLTGGNTYSTYNNYINGSGAGSFTWLGNRPQNADRPGVITFHSLEYSKYTNGSLSYQLGGFGLRWPNTSITTEDVHLRRRGTWKIYITADEITNITDAENATYSELTNSTYTPYSLGDPQVDGQGAVPTEVYFSINYPCLLYTSPSPRD